MTTSGDVLLLGATSVVGWGLHVACPSAPAVCNPFSRAKEAATFTRVAFEERDDVAALIQRNDPAMVIFCGGICNVGRCERDPEFARKMNVVSVENLLAVLPAGCRFLYCSSDHVFGGDRGPYHEDSPRAPVSVYGALRVVAEDLVIQRGGNTLLLRSGLPIGASIDGRRGHLDWLRSRTQRHLPTTLVRDERRSAIWLDALSERIWALAESDVTGVRHIVATQGANRPQLARVLDAHYQLSAQLTFDRRVDRPAPHIGDVELSTRFTDPLAAPLPSPLDGVADPSALGSRGGESDRLGDRLGKEGVQTLRD